MTSSKSTKRALATSALAILLCAAMLIGTTFAWFTDTASTGVNRIQAGNLDIEVEYAKEVMDSEGNLTGEITEFKTIQDSTEVFDGNALWEPGRREYVIFRISNKGSLALKYKFNLAVVKQKAGINKAGEEYSLADYLCASAKASEEKNFDYGSGFNPSGMFFTLWNDLSAAGTTPDLAEKPLSSAAFEGTLKAGEKHAAAMVVWMPTTVGNEANAISPDKAATIDFGINVVATQDTVEHDSFDNQYDKDAQYPDVAYTQASTQEELNTALNNPTDANGNPTSKIAVDLKKGSYTLPGDKMGNKEISITGTEDTVIDLKAGTAAHDASITMEGVTVESTNGNYTGIQHAAATTFKDCVIKGQPFLYAKDVQYINCTFEQDSSSAYNVWTYGAGNVLFKDCTFNCAGKSVLIYNEGSINGQTVEFQNCKFNASAPVAGKAAIEIDSSLLPDGGIYKVIIDQATADNVTGFDNGSVSHNSLWNNKKGTKATVIVAGTTVLSAG